jgi:hypothetical protein
MALDALQAIDLLNHLAVEIDLEAAMHNMRKCVQVAAPWGQAAPPPPPTPPPHPTKWPRRPRHASSLYPPTLAMHC